ASDDDGRADLAAGHQVVDTLAELSALAVAEPAHARGQSLERHALAREAYPPRESSVLGKELEHELVGAPDVGFISGERDPAERTASLGEERADVRRHESRIAERIRVPRGAGFAPQVVPVVESDRAPRGERHDRLAVARHRG